MPIRDYSQTPASNSNISGTNVSEGVMVPSDVNNAIRQLMADVREVQAFANIASAATVNIGAANAEYLNVTGTTNISAFDNVSAGVERELRFNGALTITNSNTSLVLPGQSNLNVSANDTLRVRSLGSGNWVATHYQPNSQGTTITGGRGISVSGSTVSIAGASYENVAAAATTNLAAINASTVAINLTGNATIDTFSGLSGLPELRVKLGGSAINITNGANISVPGGNYTGAANDTLVLRPTGNTTAEVVDIMRANGTAVVAGSSGALTLLASSSASNVSAVTLNISSYTGYSAFRVIGRALRIHATAGRVRAAIRSGSTPRSVGYVVTYWNISSPATTLSASQTNVDMGVTTWGSGTLRPQAFEMVFYRAANTSELPVITQGVYFDGTDNIGFMGFGNLSGDSTTIDNIYITNSGGGNITGEFLLYGVGQ